MKKILMTCLLAVSCNAENEFDYLAKKYQVGKSQVLIRVEQDKQIHTGQTTKKKYFRSASVGKLFTAVAILRLVENNKLKLTDKVTKYLPKWNGPNCTVENLLCHKSTLDNIDNSKAKNDWMTKNEGKQIKPQELLDFALKLPRVKGQVYSSANYILLGLIIERVTRQKYHQVIRKLVLKPMGLKETWEHTSELPKNIKPLKAYSGPYNLNKLHSSMEFADGGFVTTLKDLCKFGRLLGQGRPFKKKSTLKTMMTSRGKQNIGLGAFIDGDAFYHAGHWGVMLYVMPESNTVIAYTTNQSEHEYSKLLKELLE